MEAFFDCACAIGRALRGLVWGPATIGLILLTGVYFTVGTGFFQLRRMGLWLHCTLLAFFRRDAAKPRQDGAISQLQAASAALAGTIGTGNIVGTATALAAGGCGAIFWMWISALFGMMTKYAENVLGNHYRFRGTDGTWKGGPMVYIERGLGCRWLAVVFSGACVLASFGIGNMAQANSIAGALEESLRIPPLATGIVLTAVMTPVIFGGVKRIGALAERLVPIMALGYLGGGAIILFLNYTQIPDAFASIFAEAFSLRAAAGGVGGTMMAQAMRYGVARGVFSNEAGLGSSVIVNCASDIKEPVQQGMWGIFEVFADTLVICTVTALCIITTGSLGTGLDGAALSLATFTRDFGRVGALFLAFALCCFAFSTLLTWSYYGERALETLCGTKPLAGYKILFLAALSVGCVVQLDFVWAASDLLNGLMILPNLTALLLLSPQVFALTRRYLSKRK